jgi:peptide deformylase
MAILEILKYPDPLLHKVATPVKNITGTTAQLIEDLLDTMYAAPGVGLAAPQVGASERIVVMDVDHENPRKQVYKLINPVITRAEGEVVWEEGCLSVIDFTAEVRRAAQVEIVALDEHEKELKIAAEGLLAVALHQPSEARSLYPQAKENAEKRHRAAQRGRAGNDLTPAPAPARVTRQT